MTNEATIKIELSDKTVQMRKPKVRDLKATDDIEGQVSKEAHLACNLCQLTEDEIDEMSLVDYKKIQKEVAVFLK